VLDSIVYIYSIYCSILTHTFLIISNSIITLSTYQDKMAKFAIGTKVIIQNLINSPHYNGMKGTIKSDIDTNTSRQTVLLEEADKEIAVKSTNMKLEEDDEFVTNENGSKTRIPTKCGSPGCGSTENLKSCAKVREDTCHEGFVVCAYDMFVCT